MTTASSITVPDSMVPIPSSVPLFNIPEAFGMVECQIYRSSLPTPQSIPFLRTLNLKSVIVLTTDPPHKQVVSYLEETNVQLIHLGSRSWGMHCEWNPSSWWPVPEDLVKESLEQILNSDTWPCLVTCTSGLHETGIVIGCLRRMQVWNLNTIIVEYRSFANTKARYAAEQVIELFDLDLVNGNGCIMNRNACVPSHP